MMNNKSVRIILNILLFVSVFIFPWYVVVGISLILLAVYKPFEIIIAGVLMDSLYGTEILGTEFLFTIIFLLAYLLSLFMKRNLLIYS